MSFVVVDLTIVSSVNFCQINILTYKAYNIYFLVLNRKCLLTFNLEDVHRNVNSGFPEYLDYEYFNLLFILAICIFTFIGYEHVLSI